MGIATLKPTRPAASYKSAAAVPSRRMALSAAIPIATICDKPIKSGAGTAAWWVSLRSSLHAPPYPTTAAGSASFCRSCFSCDGGQRPARQPRHRTGITERRPDPPTTAADSVFLRLMGIAALKPTRPATSYNSSGQRIPPVGAASAAMADNVRPTNKPITVRRLG